MSRYEVDRIRYEVYDDIEELKIKYKNNREMNINRMLIKISNKYIKQPEDIYIYYNTIISLYPTENAIPYKSIRYRTQSYYAGDQQDKQNIDMNNKYIEKHKGEIKVYIGEKITVRF